MDPNFSLDLHGIREFSFGSMATKGGSEGVDQKGGIVS